MRKAMMGVKVRAGISVGRYFESTKGRCSVIPLIGFLHSAGWVYISLGSMERKGSRGMLHLRSFIYFARSWGSRIAGRDRNGNGNANGNEWWMVFVDFGDMECTKDPTAF